MAGANASDLRCFLTDQLALDSPGLEPFRIAGEGNTLCFTICSRSIGYRSVNRSCRDGVVTYWPTEWRCTLRFDGDAKALDSRRQRRGFHVEQFRGAARSVDLSACPFERAVEVGGLKTANLRRR